MCIFENLCISNVTQIEVDASIINPGAFCSGFFIYLFSY